jgi:hypothetical protein
VSPVKYGLGFYIPEDDVLHSHHRETSNLTSHSCMFRLTKIYVIMLMYVCNSWNGSISIGTGYKRDGLRMKRTTQLHLVLRARMVQLCFYGVVIACTFVYVGQPKTEDCLCLPLVQGLLFSNPHNSPNLAACECHLFTHSKQFWGGMYMN